MNCNHCGVAIKTLEEICWSCGKAPDPSLQTPEASSQMVFSAPSPPASPSAGENMHLSSAPGMYQARSMSGLGNRENETAVVDPAKVRKLQKKVRNAVIVAVIAGLLTIGAVVTEFVDAYAAVDALLIFALAYGIYKRNLTCAIALIVYFAASKTYMFLTVPEALSGGSVAVSGLVLVYLIDGAIAIKTLRSSREGF